ncbi:MAG TPA: alpha-hydroxy-acid oxidizing protein, partial [Acidimicrobiales bacterium]|nr:alpha-hydroxy-acid oxidizing protein [Acidimicrobiales bacterium]
VYIHSTAAAHSIEQAAEVSGDGPRWYQLYWPKDPEVAASLVQRAEAAGYRAIVVTLDTFMLGWRPTDLDTAYLPFLQGTGIANYLTDPAFNAPLGEGAPLADKVFRWAGMFGNPRLTWDDLAWLRERTSLPIVLKGVLHPDDARAAADTGVDGIVVSNHGGRQVDGAVAALDALPAIVEAVGDRLTVLLDSGVRNGADVVKAVALGAAAVLYGRPYVYGLGLGGQAGVTHVLRCLLGELDATVALAGRRRLADLGPDVLAPSPV